ncbi:MAG: nucleotidyltransferase domain-containing protein [Gemmatimonadaceae bacterium]|nr:nucleotidyltransferase domain-containing protein [Gloeobacterales cyanobacterium ES-bin-141]
MLVLNNLVQVLAARPEVRRVLLFGSRARGDASERSDIDLAIEAPDATSRQWLEIVAMVEDTDTLLLFDLVRLEEASEAFKARILFEGKILYERSQSGIKPA